MEGIRVAMEEGRDLIDASKKEMEDMQKQLDEILVPIPAPNPGRVWTHDQYREYDIALFDALFEQDEDNQETKALLVMNKVFGIPLRELKLFAMDHVEKSLNKNQDDSKLEHLRFKHKQLTRYRV